MPTSLSWTEVVEQLEDLGPDRHVEARDRLVGDDELGLGGKGASDDDPLPLTTGEAPAFLDEVRRWFAAILPLLAERLEPLGGNVIGLQLDNEIGMLAWVSNTPDLTDDLLASFRSWCDEEHQDGPWCEVSRRPRLAEGRRVPRRGVGRGPARRPRPVHADPLRPIRPGPHRDGARQRDPRHPAARERPRRRGRQRRPGSASRPGSRSRPTCRASSSRPRRHRAATA